MIPRLIRSLAVVLAVVMLVARPAAAQSILRDAETEEFLRDISLPLIKAAELDPKSIEIVLVGDPSINAFVAGGQNVFIHTGLILAADDVDQIQGVVAHELGHITGGHNVRFSEGASSATGISLMSLVLGAAAMAAGAGEAGMAILSGGQQAAMSKFLAFSREQESRADQAGASFLAGAHISGKGTLEFFRKLQNQEFRLGISRDDGYASTHPLSGDRIQALENVLKASPYWTAATPPDLDTRFARVKAKLIGYIEEPARTMTLYPESDQSQPAHYARAYAWHKSAYPDQAVAEARKLVEASPSDPYYLELEGQILLESGRVQDAIPPLRKAVRLAPDRPLIASLLGHALISSEDAANIEEAKSILRTSVARDHRNPFAWYQLGIAYARSGDEARAALASAERFSLEGQQRAALANGERALNSLPRGSSDWLRAQDIVLVARNEIAEKAERRR